MMNSGYNISGHEDDEIGRAAHGDTTTSKRDVPDYKCDLSYVDQLEEQPECNRQESKDPISNTIDAGNSSQATGHRVRKRCPHTTEKYSKDNESDSLIPQDK